MKKIKRTKYFYFTQFGGGLGLFILVSQIEINKIAKLGVILFGMSLLMLLLDIRGLLLSPDEAKDDLIQEID